MIYFIQATDGTGPIKIGTAISPRARLRDIQRISPTPLKILAVTEGGREEEEKLHSRFVESRLHGEWFALTPDLLEVISHCPTDPDSIEPKTGWGEVSINGQRLLHVTEAVAKSGVSERTIRRWVHKGKIRGELKNGKLYVDLPDEVFNQETPPAESAPDPAALRAEINCLQGVLEQVKSERDFLRQALLNTLEAKQPVAISHKWPWSKQVSEPGAPGHK